MTTLHLAFSLSGATMRLVARSELQPGTFRTLADRTFETVATGEASEWQCCLTALREAPRVLPDADHTQRLILYSDLSIVDQLQHIEQFTPCLMQRDTDMRLQFFHQVLRLLIQGWGTDRFTVVRKDLGFIR
jgi:hypothetical protein